MTVRQPRFAPINGKYRPIWNVLLDAGRDVWVRTADLSAAVEGSHPVSLSDILRRWVDKGWLERRTHQGEANWRLTLAGRIGVRRMLGTGDER